MTRAMKHPHTNSRSERLPAAARVPEPSQIAEELLVLRAQVGEVDSLRGLIRLWTPRLVRHATRIVRDINTAHDVVQESWISIARSLRSLDDPSRFAPWVYRIVHHKSVDLIRRECRHRDAVRRSAHQQVQARHAEAEGRSDSIDAVQEAVRRLDPERRALLGLFYVEELNLRQLADVFEVPEGTIKSRLFHARKELKQILESRDEGEQ